MLIHLEHPPNGFDDCLAKAAASFPTASAGLLIVLDEEGRCTLASFGGRNRLLNAIEAARLLAVPPAGAA